MPATCTMQDPTLPRGNTLRHLRDPSVTATASDSLSLNNSALTILDQKLADLDNAVVRQLRRRGRYLRPGQAPIYLSRTTQQWSKTEGISHVTTPQRAQSSSPSCLTQSSSPQDLQSKQRARVVRSLPSTPSLYISSAPLPDEKRDILLDNPGTIQLSESVPSSVPRSHLAALSMPSDPVGVDVRKEDHHCRGGASSGWSVLGATDCDTVQSEYDPGLRGTCASQGRSSGVESHSLRGSILSHSSKPSSPATIVARSPSPESADGRNQSAHGCTDDFLRIETASSIRTTRAVMVDIYPRTRRYLRAISATNSILGAGDNCARPQTPLSLTGPSAHADHSSPNSAKFPDPITPKRHSAEIELQSEKKAPVVTSKGLLTPPATPENDRTRKYPLNSEQSVILAELEHALLVSPAVMLQVDSPIVSIIRGKLAPQFPRDSLDLLTTRGICHGDEFDDSSPNLTQFHAILPNTPSFLLSSLYSHLLVINYISDLRGAVLVRDLLPDLADSPVGQISTLPGDRNADDQLELMGRIEMLFGVMQERTQRLLSCIDGAEPSANLVGVLANVVRMIERSGSCRCKRRFTRS